MGRTCLRTLKYMDELQTHMITAQKKCYLREIPPSIFDKSLKFWPFSD